MTYNVFGGTLNLIQPFITCSSPVCILFCTSETSCCNSASTMAHWDRQTRRQSGLQAVCFSTVLYCSAYGSLTVRSLLDTREHCLEEFHFVDPYSQVEYNRL